MPLTVEAQLTIIITSIVAGIITGVLFDIYRLIRGANVPKIIVIIEDILFWSLASLTIFAFLLYIDYAFLSAYVYIFIALSLLVYLKLISKFVIRLEKKMFQTLYKVVRILCKSFLYPIRVFYYFICGKNSRNKKMSWINII